MWKDGPERARRLANDPAVETVAVRTGMRASARWTHARSSPHRRWQWMSETSAQPVRCDDMRMRGAVRDWLARAGYTVILVTALLIAHDRPRI
ncbi:hypothetical protein WI47_33525 [Burkholderia cepacia]|nr:hypothetical protein WI47_33525 [Burkholderia cepacia]